MGECLCLQENKASQKQSGTKGLMKEQHFPTPEEDASRKFPILNMKN